MNQTISTLLTREQQATIQAMVATAESRTTGEIIPLLVARSDDYPEGVARAGAILALLLALIVCLVTDVITIWFYLPLAFLFFVPVCFLVKGFFPIIRPFIAPSRMAERVYQHALRSFYLQGLHHTKQANGVLIFISMLERKVWILGDRGVNAVIPPEQWQELASTLASGIRAGRLMESLAQTIHCIGDILHHHFPYHPDDTNELPDLLSE